MSTPKTKKSVRHVTLAPDVLDVLADHKRRQAAHEENLGEAYDDKGILSGYDKETAKQYEEGKLADRLWHKHAGMTLDVYTHLIGQREESALSVLSLPISRRSMN